MSTVCVVRITCVRVISMRAAIILFFSILLVSDGIAGGGLRYGLSAEHAQSAWLSPPGTVVRSHNSLGLLVDYPIKMGLGSEFSFEYRSDLNRPYSGITGEPGYVLRIRYLSIPVVVYYRKAIVGGAFIKPMVGLQTRFIMSAVMDGPWPFYSDGLSLKAYYERVSVSPIIGLDVGLGNIVIQCSLSAGPHPNKSPTVQPDGTFVNRIDTTVLFGMGMKYYF